MLVYNILDITSDFSTIGISETVRDTSLGEIGTQLAYWKLATKAFSNFIIKPSLVGREKVEIM